MSSPPEEYDSSFHRPEKSASLDTFQVFSHSGRKGSKKLAPSTVNGTSTATSGSDGASDSSAPANATIVDTTANARRQLGAMGGEKGGRGTCVRVSPDDTWWRIG